MTGLRPEQATRRFIGDWGCTVATPSEMRIDAAARRIIGVRGANAQRHGSEAGLAWSG